MTTVLAGDPVMANEANEALKSGTVIARGRRVTTSTPAATEQSVLRIDNVPVVNGHLYCVMTNPVAVDTTVANDIARINLRVDTTGAAATTASTLVGAAQVRLADAANGENLAVAAFKAASADGFWSVLLSTSRAAGTGNIDIVGSATFPVDLYVLDCGVDPGDTGVAL